MKTKIFLLASLLVATMVMLSCQKDLSLTPEPAVEQTMDVNQTSNPVLETSFDGPDPYVDILTNYPDPFYTRTKIKFVISKTSEVTLSVRNMKSGLSEKLVHATVNKGVYYKIFGDNKPAGMYELTLTVDGRSYKEIMTKKNKWDSVPIADGIN